MQSKVSLPERRLYFGFGVALLLLVIGSIISSKVTADLIQGNQWLFHSQQVQKKLQAILSNVQDAESGERGFLISGSEAYLRPYNAALRSLPTHLQQLQALTADNLDQQHQFPALNRSIAAKLAGLRQRIDMKRADPKASAQQIMLTGRGRDQMETIRQIIAGMEATESRVLMRRSETVKSLRERLMLLLIVIRILIFSLLALLFVLLYRYVTERRQAEMSLQQSEARFRRAIENAPVPILLHAQGGEVVAISNVWTQLTGYTADELPTVAAWTARAYGSRQDTIQAEIERLYTLEGAVREGEYTIQTKGGDMLKWEFSSAPVGKLSDGRQLVISMAVDVTERRRLEQQLIQAQKMDSIGRLAGGIAHDFNNLLTAILGFAELSEMELPEEETALRSNLNNIQKAGERAANLTRQLLAFARRQIIEPKIVNLNTLIINLDTLMRRLIREDIELIFVPKSGLNQVRVDPGQLEQVLINLVVNARDAIQEDGKIVIETDNVTLDQQYALSHFNVTPGEYVLLAVSDTGSGMSAATQERIFEPFFSTKEQGKGTGLGLATCYGIIKQNDGYIWFYSEEGKGTTFKIYLPCVDGEVEVTDTSQRASLPRGTETILLTEDQILVQDMAVQTLRAQGYTVLAAANGSEALRIAEEYAGDIHLLITDVVMPHMGGRELARRLTTQRPQTRILYISGYTENAIVHGGVLEQNIEFLPKPFTPLVLARKVRDILDSSTQKT